MATEKKYVIVKSSDLPLMKGYVYANNDILFCKLMSLLSFKCAPKQNLSYCLKSFGFVLATEKFGDQK
jgi:hypothetical protein